MNLPATSFYKCQSLTTETELLTFFGSFFGLGACSLLIPLFIIFNPSQLMTKSRTKVHLTIQEEWNIPMISTGKKAARGVPFWYVGVHF